MTVSMLLRNQQHGQQHVTQHDRQHDQHIISKSKDIINPYITCPYFQHAWWWQCNQNTISDNNKDPQLSTQAILSNQYYKSQFKLIAEMYRSINIPSESPQKEKRRIYFWGDSLSRQIFIALACGITKPSEREPIDDVLESGEKINVEFQRGSLFVGSTETQTEIHYNILPFLGKFLRGTHQVPLHQEADWTIDVFEEMRTEYRKQGRITVPKTHKKTKGKPYFTENDVIILQSGKRSIHSSFTDIHLLTPCYFFLSLLLLFPLLFTGVHGTVEETTKKGVESIIKLGKLLQAGGQVKNVPRLLYLTTPSSPSFPTTKYNKKIEHKKQCSYSRLTNDICNMDGCRHWGKERKWKCPQAQCSSYERSYYQYTTNKPNTNRYDPTKSTLANRNVRVQEEVELLQNADTNIDIIMGVNDAALGQLHVGMRYGFDKKGGKLDCL